MNELVKQTAAYQYRCKICQLINTHPEFYKEMHQLVLEGNMSLTRTMNVMNDRIERQGLDIPKLNNQNMTVHFNNHISFNDKMVVELAQNLAGGTSGVTPVKNVNAEVGQFVDDMVRRKLGNEVNDYLNIDRLRSMLMEKVEMLDTVVATCDLDGNQKFDFEAMDRYMGLIREIRKCIGDINKIRQSKQLISMVIKSLVEKNTLDIVRQMAREHDQVMKDLLAANVPEAIVQDAKMKLGLRLAEVVAVTARNAVSDVMRSYKLD